MRILLIGPNKLCVRLAEVLRTEGARVKARDPLTDPAELQHELSGVDAVVIEGGASAATLLAILRDENPAVLRVLMTDDGGIREHDGAELHELLFPRNWNRAEARILCAWVRTNTRRKPSPERPE